MIAVFMMTVTVTSLFMISYKVKGGKQKSRVACAEKDFRIGLGFSTTLGEHFGSVLVSHGGVSVVLAVSWPPRGLLVVWGSTLAY